MHILTVLCKNDWMPANLAEGWRRLGCSVEEFYYGGSLGKSWSDEGLKENITINVKLLNTARMLKAEGRLDLIFASVFDDVLSVETVKQLRKLDVPMVNYHADLVGQWYRIIKIGKYFDLVACAQRDHWSGLRRANIRPYYMPMAANPPISNQEILEQEHVFEGVLYLGSPWPYRQVILKELIESGVDLRIYGHNWWMTQKHITNYIKFLNSSFTARLRNIIDKSLLRKNIHDFYFYFIPLLLEEGIDKFLELFHRKLGYNNRSQPDYHYELINSCYKGSYLKEHYVSLVKGAAINLGFTYFSGKPGNHRELRQLRLREIEIPMYGGFLLTQDCSQLREMFDVGTNSIAWNDIYDLEEKIKYYLKRPSERQQISDKAMHHCLENHTWQNRFSKLLLDLNISQPHLS